MSCFIIEHKEYAKAAELFNMLAREKKMSIPEENIVKYMEKLEEINYEAYNYRYNEDERCPVWKPASHLDVAIYKEKFEKDYKKGKHLLCAKLYSFMSCVRYQCCEGPYEDESATYINVFFDILLNYLLENTHDWSEIEL